jgi:hypothetical protein
MFYEQQQQTYALQLSVVGSVTQYRRLLRPQTQGSLSLPSVHELIK